MDNKLQWVGAAFRGKRRGPVNDLKEAVRFVNQPLFRTFTLHSRKIAVANTTAELVQFEPCR